MKKTSTAPAPAPEISTGISFAQAFMRGEIEPFAEAIEDSDALAEAVDEGSEEAAFIESAVMELGHGACHALTLALVKELKLETVVVIRGAGGMPVHSAIHDPSRELILDANGVHDMEDAIAFWEDVTGERCTYSYEDPDMLEAFYDCDEDEMALAIEDFGIIAEFAKEEILSEEIETSSPSI